MTATQSPPPVKAARPPLWRDVRVLRVAGQVLVVLVVLAVLRQLFMNLVDGLNETGISTDFDFLDQQTGFRVADADFDPSSPSKELFILGAKNTALSAVIGITIASVVGLLIGIARLSTNWLVAKFAQLYVESFRNIPPLVIIIFFNAALFRDLNPIRQASQVKIPILDEVGLIYSNSKWGIPWFIHEDNAGTFWTIVLVAIAAAVGIWIWRTRVEINTGQPSRRAVIAPGFVIAVALAALVMLQPITATYPTLDGNRLNGGFSFTTAYLAVTLALGLYTASHIAEIIRGSILAVHKGQFEAANALALSGIQRYRFVILPQALRIAVPPIISQFLNLTKNTSLATAVAYPELTLLTKTLIGNGKPAPQSIMVAMLVYLSFSLAISLIVNVINRRFQLVTR